LLQTPQLGIIYFFFNHSDRTQTAEIVIRVLLRQILEQLDNLPDMVISEYSRYKHDRHKRMPDRETFVRLLAFSIEQFYKGNKNQVFILVDAYDELLSTKENAGGAALEKSAVRSSLSVINQTNCAKILITTRPHHCQELQNTFQESRIIDIQGNHQDMETYIKGQMQPFDFPEALQKVVLSELLQSNLGEKWYFVPLARTGANLCQVFALGIANQVRFEFE
jgi:hypothetical protein